MSATATAPMPLRRRSPSKSSTAAIAQLDERLAGHDRRDDDRFGALTGSVEELREDVRTIDGKVNGLVDDVGVIKGQMLVIGKPPPPPPVLPPDDWHIGPRAWALLAGIAFVIMGALGWLGSQVYDLQPARIAQSQRPQMIQVVQPQPKP